MAVEEGSIVTIVYIAATHTKLDITSPFMLYYCRYCNNVYRNTIIAPSFSIIVYTQSMEGIYIYIG